MQNQTITIQKKFLDYHQGLAYFLKYAVFTNWNYSGPIAQLVSWRNKTSMI